MKKIMFFLLFSFALPAFAQMRSATITAGGLTCSMCSKAIYKALQKVPFIKEVQPDVDGSKYVILFKENIPVVIDDMKKAVEHAGFTVTAMQVTASFNNTEVYNDAHVSIDGTTLHFLHVDKQNLQGDKTFTIVDKNYLPVSKHKSYAQYTKMECFETGMMAACCPGKSTPSGRIYHVTL
jgi:copper chaperone CopZ